MSALQFPSSEQVEAANAVKELETIKWSELTSGTVYAITKIKTVKCKYESSVADLETQDGEHYKTWLPQRLATDIKGHKLPVYDYTVIDN